MGGRGSCRAAQFPDISWPERLLRNLTAESQAMPRKGLWNPAQGKLAQRVPPWVRERQQLVP